MPRPRKKPKKTPEKRLHIFCEGAKTEPDYIQKYISDSCEEAKQRVIIIEPTRKNTPAQLVDEAVALRNSGKVLKSDEFWAVYDRESIAKYAENIHENARRKAKNNSINVCLSNVCFEYWILLHLKNTNAPFSSHDDLMANSDFKALFKQKSGKDYEKGAGDAYNVLKQEIATARERAKALNKDGKDSAPAHRRQPHQINPYIELPYLLDAIDNFKT